MFGLGLQEVAIVLVLILIIGFFVYGTSMLVDAIRRPQQKFRLGGKVFWIPFLILTNPLISRFIGGYIYIFCIVAFVIGSLVYHLANRRNNPLKSDRLPATNEVG